MQDYTLNQAYIFLIFIALSLIDIKSEKFNNYIVPVFEKLVQLIYNF